VRVLQVLPQLKGGGVERATIELAHVLAEQFGHTYVASQGGQLVGELEGEGSIHFTLALATKNPLCMIYNGFALARLVRHHNIQIIHARSRAPAWSCLWTAKLTGVPLITTYHGCYKNSNSLKKFYNSVMTRGKCVIAISQFVADYIKTHHAIDAAKIRLIYEGIDLEKFNPKTVSAYDIDQVRQAWNIPQNSRIILLPGRVTRIKGHHIFLDALRKMTASNFTALILGPAKEKSSYKDELVRQAANLPVHFIENYKNMAIAYAAADFIVSPSLVPEAFGRVVAEAGAMERLIIASSSGATPELCQSGKTGYLLPMGDSVALGKTMDRVLTLSPQEKVQMGQAARLHIANTFSLKTMSDKTIDLYKELIS
jgi:glycosyltransferase involved in cell wall biosynthesis